MAAQRFVDLIERALAHPRPEVGLVMLQLGAPMMAAILGDEPEGDLFEEWLIERWRRDARSPEFQASAQYQYLLAEWERAR